MRIEDTLVNVYIKRFNFSHSFSSLRSSIRDSSSFCLSEYHLPNMCVAISLLVYSKLSLQQQKRITPHYSVFFLFSVFCQVVIFYSSVFHNQNTAVASNRKMSQSYFLTLQDNQTFLLNCEFTLKLQVQMSSKFTLLLKSWVVTLLTVLAIKECNLACSFSPGFLYLPVQRHRYLAVNIFQDKPNLRKFTVTISSQTRFYILMRVFSDPASVKETILRIQSFLQNRGP